MKQCLVYIFLFFASLNTSFSQDVFSIEKGKGKFRLGFQLVNDLVIIPVEINGVELSFLLDTGVNSTIIFSLEEADTLAIKNTAVIYLKGLAGGEPIEAIHSSGNEVKIGKAIKDNLSLYLVLDQGISLSSRLGVPIHGIIGHDFLKDFVVEFNYLRKKIKVYHPESYKYRSCRRCEDFPLTLYKNKPYVNAFVQIESQDHIPVNLLIDSGSGDALWLFQDSEKGIRVPDKHIEDFLGFGIGGSVYGSRSRIKSLSLGDFKIENVIASYPDTSFLKGREIHESRSGSIGGQILKRFRVTIDYSRSLLRLKPNRKFNAPFEYDMSGIILAHEGYTVIKDYQRGIRKTENKSATGEIAFTSDYQVKFSLEPQYKIVEVRPDSPAKVAGLRQGDLILKINGRPAYKYNLSQISSLLGSKEGKTIKLLVERKGVRREFSFKLERLL